MKYIGIDYGTKRIGIALSDDEGSFAFPKEIVPRDKAFAYICTLLEDKNIGGIIIGYSIASNEE